MRKSRKYAQTVGESEKMWERVRKCRERVRKFGKGRESVRKGEKMWESVRKRGGEIWSRMQATAGKCRRGRENMELQGYIIVGHEIARNYRGKSTELWNFR